MVRCSSLLVSVVFLACGCGGGQRPLSAADSAASLDVDAPALAATDEAPDLPATNARTSCYFGDLFVTAAGRAESPQGALLVRLTLDQDNDRILEDTWSFPLYERYLVTRSVRGNQFQMTQDDGAFVGTGALDGEAWLWRGWTTRAASADAQTIVETATRFDDGVLVTRERVLGADGAVKVEVRHSLDEIPLDECDNMFARAATIRDQGRDPGRTPSASAAAH
jgi:hypothetical protein